MREGISPIKDFDVSDINAEMAAERKKKTEKSKTPPKGERILTEQNKSKAQTEQDAKLAKARADLAAISNKEIEGALENLEETEELSEEDIEELN